MMYESYCDWFAALAFLRIGKYTIYDNYKMLLASAASNSVASWILSFGGNSLSSVELPGLGTVNTSYSKDNWF